MRIIDHLHMRDSKNKSVAETQVLRAGILHFHAVFSNKSTLSAYFDKPLKYNINSKLTLLSITLPL